MIPLDASIDLTSRVVGPGWSAATAVEATDYTVSSGSGAFTNYITWISGHGPTAGTAYVWHFHFIYDATVNASVTLTGPGGSP